MDVLIAHPSADTRRWLDGALRRAGHEVSEASGAAQALAACRAEPPDVLLLSWAPCERDCRSVVEAVKADPDVFRTAVVVLASEELGLEQGRELMRRGAQDFLVEPVRDFELVARVQAAGRTKTLQEELVEQTRRLESHLYEDPLTRVHNRRFVFAQLSSLVSGARRHGRPMAVAVVDLDGFQAVNDRHGHLTGDAVLAAAARALRSAVRAEDVVGRFGGEEFLVLLPDADEDAAARAAERLRAAISEMDAPVPVTTSVGYAVLGEDEGPDDIVRRADSALYAAKSAGRDRVRSGAIPAATLQRRS